jgi:spore maturation protein CgeB
MRIFYAADSTPNPYFESNIWEDNLYLPLIDLKHEVLKFNYNLRDTFKYLNPSSPEHQKFISKNRPNLSKELLHQITQKHTEKPIDLFFSYFYDLCVLPETIDEIKSMGIKTINWYSNASHQFDLISTIAPHYDYILTPEKMSLNDYKKISARTIYCQMAANPTIYKEYNLAKEFDVTFVGQAYGERPDYIQYLLKNKINVNVWGSNWDFYTKKSQQYIAKLNSRNGDNTITRYIKKLKKLPTKAGIIAIKKRLLSLIEPKEKISILPAKIMNTFLSDKEMVKMYSRSKINLGFATCGHTHLHEKRVTQMRLRDFEVTMSGGFYITEYTEELADFFDIEKEIVCYSNKEELADKIKYYLKNETERERIRIAGKNRCLKDHTWKKRFKMVFEKIFNDVKR